MKDKLKNIFNKKTIYYVESLTYVLSIIIVVIANVFGPVWLRMIPLLFVLGVIGKIVFDRPVVTTIFGCIVSICILRISGVTNILENIISSGIFTLYIALGELCGSKLKEVYKYLMKERKSGKGIKEYRKNLIISICIIVICILFHNYTDSNIFTYDSCKSRLIAYLNENYTNEEFDITAVKYNYDSENNFKFNVKQIDTNDTYKFVVYVDKDLEIYDGIKESKIAKEELEIENVINSAINNKYENIQVEIEKTSEKFDLILTKEVDSINDTEVLNFSNEVVEIIDLVLANQKVKENIIHVDISLIDSRDKTKNKISTIYVSNYIKNKEEDIQKSYTYIMKSLDIEYID